MNRAILRILIGLVVLGTFGFGVGIWGYYTHKWQINPIFSLAERAEVKLRRQLGLKTDTELAIERIETTFVTLRGRAHVMPSRTFINGGALSVWGEDLLILHRTGKLFWLDRDEEEGMVLSGFTPPPNGARAYAALAAEKYPGRNTREESIRYNDLDYIDATGHRGLALSYTYVNVAEECYTSRIAWLDLPGGIASIRDLDNSAEDWEVIFETTPCLTFNDFDALILGYMSGGRMAFKAPNLLYTGVGEYHRDGIYRPDAGIQSDDSDYGKTVEINLDTRSARHFSKGHRNVQGITLDREGRIWTTEHGMRGGDELNLIRDGANYGWPLVDMGTLYSGVPQNSISGPGRHTDFTPPVYAWVPSAAISSVTPIDGFHDTWDGDLLISTLRTRQLFRARIHDDRLVSMEPIPIGQRVRDVMQWGEDRIALWLDLNEVVILEIEPRSDPLNGLADDLITEGMATELASAAVGMLSGTCAECHAYQADIHGIGPSLAGVTERHVASGGYSGYSSALLGLGGTWTQERLAAYLADPSAVADGTYMEGMGVGNADLAAALAKALTRIKAVQVID